MSEKSEKTILAVFHGDHHVNDTVGLCPPRFELERGHYEPKPPQIWLWRCWLEFWKKVAALKAEHRAFCLSVWLGDIGDVNAHSNAELITVNEEWIIEAMAEVAAPALQVADCSVVVRGTAAHTGGTGKLEELFAQRIGAAECADAGTASWYVWRADLGGVDVLATHHPASGSRIPDKLDDACNRCCAFTYKSFDRCGGQPPQWAVWGHVHKRAVGTYLAGRLNGRFLPPWKLVGNYGYRIGTVTPEPVGGWYMVARGGRVLAEDFITFSAPRRKPWTVEAAGGK